MTLTKRIFTERRRVILPLVVFLLANVAGLGAVLWLQRGEANAELDRLQTDTELAEARKLAMQAKDQKTRKERADVELRKFYADILPRDFASARNMTNFWLGRIAASSRLRYRGGTFDPAPVRDSRLIKFTGEVTLVGEYADIRRFLYEVESAQEFLIIERVALSQPNATQAGAQLEVALSVATYFLAEAQPGGVSK